MYACDIAEGVERLVHRRDGSETATRATQCVSIKALLRLY